jgi:hypothetical protein
LEIQDAGIKLLVENFEEKGKEQESNKTDERSNNSNSGYGRCSGDLRVQVRDSGWGFGIICAPDLKDFWCGSESLFA